MRLILTSGLALFEVLISLLLLSLTLFGLEGMLLCALNTSRKVFFTAKAEQQMHNLEERLRVQTKEEDFLDTLEDWNRENKMILPQGEGFLTESYPDYVLSLCFREGGAEKTCLREKWRGATLIELMITFTLSLMVISLATGLYLAMEMQNERLNSWAVEEEKANFILQRLEGELHLAGFIGCPRLTEDFPLANETPYALNAHNKLEIQLDSNGSSVLIIRSRSSIATHLQEAMHQSSTLVLPSSFEVKPGTLLLISDCRHADLFQVAEVEREGSLQQVRTTRPLVYHYGVETEIGLLNIRKYFVKKTGRRDRSGREIYSLYLQDREDYQLELVEGVQKLQARLTAENRAVVIELQLALNDSLKTEYGFVALRN